MARGSNVGFQWAQISAPSLPRDCHTVSASRVGHGVPVPADEQIAFDGHALAGKFFASFGQLAKGRTNRGRLRASKQAHVKEEQEPLHSINVRSLANARHGVASGQVAFRTRRLFFICSIDCASLRRMTGTLMQNPIDRDSLATLPHIRRVSDVSVARRVANLTRHCRAGAAWVVPHRRVPVASRARPAASSLGSAAETPFERVNFVTLPVRKADCTPI